MNPIKRCRFRVRWCGLTIKRGCLYLRGCPSLNRYDMSHHLKVIVCTKLYEISYRFRPLSFTTLSYEATFLGTNSFYYILNLSFKTTLSYMTGDHFLAHLVYQPMSLNKHALSVIVWVSVGVIICAPPLATGLDIEAFYMVHICTYVPHICTSNI